MRATSVLAAGAAAVALAGAFAAAAQGAGGDPAKGADVFDDRCSSCHVLGGEGQGPNLIGIVGRKAGSLPGYGYSDAIKASGLVWTPANLDRFLTGPKKLVPGTAMAAIVPDPNQRRDLIAFLAAKR